MSGPVALLVGSEEEEGPRCDPFWVRRERSADGMKGTGGWRLGCTSGSVREDVNHTVSHL